MASKQLAPHEKALVFDAVRAKFDALLGTNPSSWRGIKSWQCIKVAVKLSLARNSINEMIDDYNDYYNKNLKNI